MKQNWKIVFGKLRSESIPEYEARMAVEQSKEEHSCGQENKSYKELSQYYNCWKLHVIKEEQCGCEAQEWSIEHTGSDHEPKTEDTGECILGNKQCVSNWLAVPCPHFRRDIGISKEATTKDSHDTIPVPLNKDWSDRFDKLSKDWFNFPETTRVQLMIFISQEIESARASERKELLEKVVDIVDGYLEPSVTDTNDHPNCKYILDEDDRDSLMKALNELDKEVS